MKTKKGHTRQIVSVAIVGSGPAGLVAATHLAGAGFKAVVYDELPEFGGMIAYGIPEFRIPLKIVREKIALAKKEGVIFRRQKIFSVKSLLNGRGEKFNFVILAIGAGPGAKTGFEGENDVNVIDALDFLMKDKLEKKPFVSKGDSVAIIGGGNSAVDAARVAVRQGARATILYRRTENEMPAMRSETNAARKEGVKFKFLKCPIKYGGAEKVSELVCAEMVLADSDQTGRRKPVETGKTQSFEFNKVIIATGQRHDFSWLEKEGVKTDGKVILVDSNYRTSLKNVYACGDCVTGAKTIMHATKAGVAAAKAIIAKVKEAAMLPA